MQKIKPKLGQNLDGFLRKTVKSVPTRGGRWGYPIVFVQLIEPKNMYTRYLSHAPHAVLVLNFQPGVQKL